MVESSFVFRICTPLGISPLEELIQALRGSLSFHSFERQIASKFGVERPGFPQGRSRQIFGSNSNGKFNFLPSSSTVSHSVAYRGQSS